MSTFSDFPLLPALKRTLTDLGLAQPTEVQARAVPELLKGRSMVAIAETGSGKTLAFALPMVHQLKELESSDSFVNRGGRPRGVVIVPGRELGEQVCKVLKSLTHGARLRVRLAVGGTAKQVARQNVTGDFEILVATPGRMKQLLDGRALALDDVRMVVFDEADQLLDRGFLPFASRVVDECREGVQVAMFTATMRDALDSAVAGLLDRAPLRISTSGSHKLNKALRTDNRRVDNGRRIDTLRRLLREAPHVGTLLFANTRAQCQQVTEWLDAEGVGHVTYMGQMDRLERRRNLEKFRSGEVSFLLTTDLGGRGLDIDRVDRVVNIHLPQDLDNYVHRVGRTARAGRSGLVVNFVTRRDQPLLQRIDRLE